ncbi:hypothetical protein V499_00576 [Pseudogymnoascus sp. VKM F-103]|nr:hypothetical protein V499_00576 [Pseudogymnoascus sp. VKM F-103]
MSNTNGTNGSNGAHRVNGANGANGKHEIPPVSKPHRVDFARTTSRGPPIDTTWERVNSFPLPPHTATPGGPTARSQAKVRSYGQNEDPKCFPRISKPVELLRTSYDVLVIGSGYGGGVAACRMARAGQTVCLLERGKERWPGEYPSTLLEATKELHISGEVPSVISKPKMIDKGDPTGLYHLIMGEGQNAFVGNGLGGTSLLNANVFLRTDDGTMGLHNWPPELRKPGALNDYYELAEKMLEPQKYPDEWPELPKLNMLETQANHLGWGDKFRRVPQTTRFSAGANSTGVEMNASALTGQDTTGLNDGSKSSTLVNYLSDAWNWGAEMFCECEVRYIKEHPDEGYIVYFAWHGSGRGAFTEHLHEDLMWVHAKKCVFLGAGSLGTTEILLRSKAMGLSTSSTLGTGMSGNGDILAFGYNCNENVNAIGREFPSPYHPIGPTIAGIIDCREGHENPLDGFVIEEGAIPKALAPLFQVMLELMPGTAHHDVSLIGNVRSKLASIGSHILGPYYQKGSVEKTMVYLVMSHDSNQAILSLKNDKPLLKFLGVGRSDHVEYLNDILAQATSAVGGTFVNSPFYAALGKQEITVHPIGGACMSSCGTGRTGTTNHFGQVFKGNGKETHEGLIVTDGAIVPTALGVNPLATITALAERSVKYTADRMGVTIDYDTKNGLLDLFGFPKHVITGDDSIVNAESLIEETAAGKVSGFEFSEVMSGFIHFGENMEGDRTDHFEVAARTGRGLCEGARFFLSVKAWNTHTIVRRPDHSAMLTGTLVCAGLPGSPFMIKRGDFGLFSANQSISGTKNLTYSFQMIGTDREKYQFEGFKTVNAGVVLNPIALWRATSTLYVTIKRLNGTVIGRGILHIKPTDFLSEARTLTPTGDGLIAKATSTISFLSYFAKQAASLFFTPFSPLQYPSHTPRGFINTCTSDGAIAVIASDGVKTYMNKWESTHPDPAYPVHDLFMVPGASVDHQIFSLQTIPKNAVQYFTERGYRVWVLTHRIGMNMEPTDKWTTFDARLDIRAALAYIRSVCGNRKIYTIAHCMGSVALASGMLDGTIPVEWIKGLSCSQVFMNPQWARINMAKVMMPFDLTRAYRLLGGNWFSCSSSEDDTLVQRAIDQDVFCFWEMLEPRQPQRSNPRTNPPLLRRRQHVPRAPPDVDGRARPRHYQLPLSSETYHAYELAAPEGSPDFLVQWRG